MGGPLLQEGIIGNMRRWPTPGEKTPIAAYSGSSQFETKAIKSGKLRE
jgi:hypothetical protein